MFLNVIGCWNIVSYSKYQADDSPKLVQHTVTLLITGAEGYVPQPLSLPEHIGFLFNTGSSLGFWSLHTEQPWSGTSLNYRYSNQGLLDVQLADVAIKKWWQKQRSESDALPHDLKSVASVDVFNSNLLDWCLINLNRCMNFIYF